MHAESIAKEQDSVVGQAGLQAGRKKRAGKKHERVGRIGQETAALDPDGSILTGGLALAVMDDGGGLGRYMSGGTCSNAKSAGEPLPSIKPAG